MLVSAVSTPPSPDFLVVAVYHTPLIPPFTSPTAYHLTFCTGLLRILLLLFPPQLRRFSLSRLLFLFIPLDPPRVFPVAQADIVYRPR